MTEVPKPTSAVTFRVCLLLCEEKGKKHSALSLFLPASSLTAHQNISSFHFISSRKHKTLFKVPFPSAPASLSPSLLIFL